MEIVKDVETNELFVMCDECENEWNNPTEVKSQKARTEINDNRGLISYSTKGCITVTKGNAFFYL